ncbi:MAG: hypothetical protein JRI23_27655 [Deltaproteobacteria bacterium]|jgi:hypothetical protein|nr:hypothetical protein [Deltaproteobacteria bacterium]MBW2535857.1 hypothetical protein [Deltaproteobacteria bacterium]
MHPAHPLPPDRVSMGAGFSSQFAIDSTTSDLAPVAQQVVHEGMFAPGLAPWAGGRMGIEGDYEAGLTYSGRTIRLDLRRAFVFGAPALSLGLGASGVLPKRRDDLAFRAGGGGADVPLLFGLRSSADIFALWLGARGGFEYLQGSRDLELAPDSPIDGPTSEEISAWHGYVGGLAGLRVGFRHVFAVLEVDAAMHWADGDVGPDSVSVRQLGIAPGGALIGQF